MNKSPRGPLTEAEVRTLLAQGVVRHNDLAYRVSVDDPKEKSDWKLIWQFDDFDRRTPESFQKKKPSAPEKEQRDANAEETIKSNMADLPQELIDIHPEELIPRSRAVAAQQAIEDTKWNTPPSDGGGSSSPRFSLSGLSVPRWMYGLAAAGFISFLFFRWISTKNLSTSRFAPNMPPVEATNGEEPAQRAMPRGTASRRTIDHTPFNRPTPGAVVPTERPRDNNEPPAERDLDRDRDRDRDDRGEAEESKNEAAAEPAGDDNGDGERAPSNNNNNARRPTFRKKAGGNIDENADPVAPISDSDQVRSNEPLPDSQD